MADEGKGIALVILGIVAIVAITGLVLLFRGGASGAVTAAEFDKNTGTIVGSVDTSQQLCFVTPGGNIVCPGAPKETVGACISQCNQERLYGGGGLECVQNCVKVGGPQNCQSCSLSGEPCHKMCSPRIACSWCMEPV